MEEKKEENLTEEKPQEEQEKTPDEENTDTPEETEDKPEEKPEEDKEQDEEDKTSDDVDFTNIKDAKEAEDALKAKGFDYVELQKEYDEKGEISKETRAKLAEVGITDEVLDNYIEGQKAIVQQEYDKLSECIGGREVFDTVIKWAGENLDPDEIASINTVRDKNVLKIILKDLKSRMEEKEGVTPEYQKGEGAKPTKDIYRSQAEMFEDIMNPKYKKDEAYRQDVQKKIAASREAGIDLGI